MEAVLTQKRPADGKQMQRMQLINKAGGSENRGILSDIKARDLPPEALNEFSSAPFDFEKTAVLLWEDTLKIYDHACIENRLAGQVAGGAAGDAVEDRSVGQGEICL